jgi:hypothetical protein
MDRRDYIILRRLQISTCSGSISEYYIFKANMYWSSMEVLKHHYFFFEYFVLAHVVFSHLYSLLGSAISST